MTQKTENTRSAMEALDEGLGATTQNVGERHELEATQEIPSPDSGLDMPPGFAQSPTASEEDADDKAWAKFVRTNYAYCVLGIALAPFAFLVRVGRWSMRTLWQHHVGGEFGGF